MSNIITVSTGAVSATDTSLKQDDRDQLHVPDFDLLDSKLEPVTNSKYDELMDQLDADPEFDQILADLPSINSEATCANSSTNCVTSVTPAGVSNVFSCNYQWNTRFQPYPQPMITSQNAHVTINYNIFNN